MSRSIRALSRSRCVLACSFWTLVFAVDSSTFFHAKMPTATPSDSTTTVSIAATTGFLCAHRAVLVHAPAGLATMG